jgi:hypothetical protein
VELAQGRGGAGKPPIGIAFEGDLGNRVDAVLAVAMLNGLASKNEARKIALTIPKPSLKSAQLADVISAFYAGRPIPGPGGATGGNPDGLVGMPDGTLIQNDRPALAAALDKKNADGTPAYTTIVARQLDTADDAVLIRNMLLAQNDGNAIVVLAGPASGLVRLMGLYGVTPQLTTKAQRLVVALGAFPDGPAEASVAADIAAARKLFAEWPTRIVAAGAEVGAALPYPGATLDEDFGWSPAHPIADAYRALKPMPYDAPTAALAAVLFAVHPDDGYFKLSEPGTITVLDDGRTKFTPGANGKHQYLVVDPAQKDRVIKEYRDMASVKPTPKGRGSRGAPPAAALPPPAARPAAAPPAAQPNAAPATKP